MSHDLNPSITTRYVRFQPGVSTTWISMRVELYGCQGIASSIYSNLFITGVIICYLGSVSHSQRIRRQEFKKWIYLLEYSKQFPSWLLPLAKAFI